MASKSRVQVVIGGKIYTMSGYEGEEYLQKVAAYLNKKIEEIQSAEGYQRMNSDMRALLLNLNTADDYFKMKKQTEQASAQLTAKDKELYDMKHELIQTQLQLENARKELAALKDEDRDFQQRIAVLEAKQNS